MNNTISDLRASLVHGLTRYDRRRVNRRDYNPYALAQYLARIDEIMEDIDRGATPRAAVIAAFSGQLCDVALKAIGEAPAGREEATAWKPTATYTPASEQEPDADDPSPGMSP